MMVMKVQKILSASYTIQPLFYPSRWCCIPSKRSHQQFFQINSYTVSEIGLTAVYHWLFEDKSIRLPVKSQDCIQNSYVLKLEKF